jgi:hypothetical protein
MANSGQWVQPAPKARKTPSLSANTAEKLWYLGLVGRAALRENQDLSEFAFIPDEFLDWLPESSKPKWRAPPRVNFPPGPAPK